MFLKQEDTPFSLPLTYYDEPERTSQAMVRLSSLLGINEDERRSNL